MELTELFHLQAASPLLEQALTHPSFANEQHGMADNQRLEFLGDAVLQFCASEVIFERHPGADEGTLTRLRAQLVNAEALAMFARAHGVAGQLRLGRGAVAAGLDDSTNVLADAIEALIAACYLEHGLDAARAACQRVVDYGLERLQATGALDPKSELQERVQALGHRPPTYAVVASGGPPHARWFEVAAHVGEERVGVGRGRSKRQAERLAAARALESDAVSTLKPPDAVLSAQEPTDED